MKPLKIVLMMTAVGLLALLAGCCCGGGTDTKETTVIEKQVVGKQTTLGDELLKLQDARDRGTLTAAEYDTARKRVLNAAGERTLSEADLADELLKLQDARDRGALTEEEFASAKQKMLKK